MISDSSLVSMHLLKLMTGIWISDLSIDFDDIISPCSP